MVVLTKVVLGFSALLAVAGTSLILWPKPPVIYLDKAPELISTRHLVTPEMEAAAASLKRQPTPKFSLQDLDGQPFTEASLKDGVPSILIFMKADCPCTIEAQPIFNDMARKFGGDARFYGIIDRQGAEAKATADYLKIPFPVLQDPDMNVIQSFRVVASASFALIDGEGNIVKVWPGYSKDVLRQANLLLGTLAKTGPKEFDDAAAPNSLTAGCVFEFKKKSS